MRNNDPLRPYGQISTGELLCLPFLDTDNAKDTELANTELSNRGYPSWVVFALRKLCAVGLWTQLFIWEDVHLDLSDVAAGYGLLLLGLGIAAVVLGNFAIPKLAIVGLVMVPVGLILLGIAVLGWRQSRRKGQALIEQLKEKGEL